MSSRELEILRKSAEGLTPEEIASELNLNQKEINKLHKGILQRTGSTNEIMALQVIAKNGFVLTEERR